jgi:hypothetical protein
MPVMLDIKESQCEKDQSSYCSTAAPSALSASLSRVKRKIPGWAFKFTHIRDTFIT